MADINKFAEYMKTQKAVECGTEIFEMFDELAQEAMKITFEINHKYHTPDEIRELF